MELTMSSVDESVLICGPDIKVREVVTLVPSKPTPTGTLYLSNIDLALVFPVETIYFFHPPPSDKPCTEHVVDKMKGSLSRLLVPYHFLAGRLQLNPGDGRLELNYNRSGVLFAGASSELTLVQLGDVSRPNLSFRNLIVKTDEFKELSNTPLMTLQVTRFKCGGFCVGLVTNHSLMDGQSIAEFLQNLASIARGEGLFIEPKFDRTSLKARIRQQDKMTASTVADTYAYSLKRLRDIQFYRTFTFSQEILQRLKQKVLKDNIISRCSTFQVLAAHLWQARTKALFEDPTQTSTLYFAANIRSKVNPPLPKGFVGNGAVTAYASASVREVKENPLSYCVAEIQKAITSVTDDYVRAHIDWLEVHRCTHVSISGKLFLSAWWKLPFYEFDLGWGKPVYAGPTVNSWSEFVFLNANGSQQAINVGLILEPCYMEKFEKHIKEI